MENLSARTDEGRRAQLDWRGRLASALLGTTGGGLVINILSNDYRWRVAAAALGLGAIVAVAAWLHRRPEAPITRWGIQAMLLAALAATVLAAVGPTSVAPWATGAASVFTFGAALVPADRGSAMLLLRGTTTIATGTVIAILGVALGAGNAVIGVIVGIGAALAAQGVSVLTGGSGHTAVISLGVAIAALGIGLLKYGDAVAGIVGVGVGTAITVVGLAVLADRRAFVGASGIGLGIAVAAGGVILLTDFNAMSGISVLVAAPAVVAHGVAVLVRSRALFAVSSIGLGVPIAAGGLTMVLADSYPLLIGVVIAGAGVSIINTGVNELWRGVAGERLRAWWARASVPAVRRPPDTATEEAGRVSHMRQAALQEAPTLPGSPHSAGRLAGR